MVGRTHQVEFSFELRNETKPCFFDGGDGEFAADAGILFQKLVQSVAAFQIFDQNLEGHSDAAENRLTAENVRILDDDAGHLHSPRQLKCTAKGVEP